MKTSSINTQFWKNLILFLSIGVALLAASPALGDVPKLKWSQWFFKHMNKTLSIGNDGTIYALGFDRTHSNKLPSYLHALEPDGSVKWTLDTESVVGGFVGGNPVIGPDDTIYMLGYVQVGGNREGKLYAFTPQGNLKSPFPFSVHGKISQNPAIGLDGTIYFCSEVYPDSKVYAVSPDGIQQWNYEFQTYPGIARSTTIGPDGTVYIVYLRNLNQNSLYAFNPNGTLKWALKETHTFSTAPAISSNGTIYIGSRTEGLTAIRANGTVKWKLPDILSNLDFNSSPVIQKDTVYANSSDGKLYAVLGGTIQWSYDLNTTKVGLTVGQSGLIYANGNNFIHAINSVNGTLNWSYSISGSRGISSPVLGSDGIIYITTYGTYDGNVIAIDSGKIDRLSQNSSWPTFGQNNRRKSNVQYYSPKPISPINNTIVQAVQDQSVEFKWEKQNHVWDNYRVMIAANPGFNQAFSSEEITLNSYLLNSDMLTPGHQYFWKVIRLPRYGSIASSGLQSFIYGSPLKHPMLHMPNYGETVELPVLMAYEFPDAVQYEIIIGTDPELTEANRIIQDIVSGTATQISTLTPGTTYYWSVCPKDANGQDIGACSPIFQFKTTAQ